MPAEPTGGAACSKHPKSIKLIFFWRGLLAAMLKDAKQGRATKTASVNAAEPDTETAPGTPGAARLFPEEDAYIAAIGLLGGMPEADTALQVGSF